MRRSTFLFVLLVILTLVAVQTGRRLMFTLVYLLGGTLVLSFLWSWLNLQWLTISRVTQSQRAQAGKPFEERFIVRNNSRLPKLWLELRDFSTLPGHRASRVVNSLPGNHARGWAVKVIARKRGRYRLGPLRILTGDPFGLFKLSRDLAQTASIVVYPAVVELSRFAPPLGEMIGGESIQRRTHHITPNVSGIRDYVPGDSFNRIHWKSSARTGRLIVKEFEEDPTANIWVVLDGYHQFHVDATTIEDEGIAEPAVLHLSEHRHTLDPSTEEYAVTIAASLAQYFLTRNRSLGLIVHGQEREVLPPDRGLRQLTKVLESLAVIRMQGNLPLENVLTLEQSFFTRGTTLIVVTSSPFHHWVDALRELRRRGVRATAVLLDPNSFVPTARTPDEALASLAMAGIPTYLVKDGDNLDVALNKPIGGQRAA
jgi:uncharacterized protein (DUF58 family)